MLGPNDKVLILTSAQSDANELYKFIAQGNELSHHIRLSDIHFGPISNPPLNSVFSLVIYFSVPKKLEQFFCHISMLYNNYYFRTYGQLNELPKIHFHVFVSQDDFSQLRHKTFLKKVTRLQINRLLKKLDDIYQVCQSEKENRGEKEGAGGQEVKYKMSLNRISKVCDMNRSLIVRTLRQCQAEKLIMINQPYPTSFNVRVINSSRDTPMLKKILEVSKKSSGVYRVSQEIFLTQIHPQFYEKKFFLFF